MRRLVVLVGVLALVAACNGSGGGGSRDAFCSRLKRDQKLLGSGEAAHSQAVKRAVREFDALVDDAPGEIRGDMKVAQGLLRKLAKANPKDLAGFGEIFTAALDPKVIRATTRLNAYARDKCHVDLGAQAAPESSPRPSPSPAGTGGLDASAIRAYLDERYLSAPWHGHITGAGIGSGDHETKVEVDTDLPPDERSRTTALDICRAASTLVYEQGHLDNATLTVNDVNNAPLVERAGSQGSCKPKT
jgi:hypothetical protein